MATKKLVPSAEGRFTSEGKGGRQAHPQNANPGPKGKAVGNVVKSPKLTPTKVNKGK